MRILQVIPFFSPHMGGSAQVAYHISRRLGERGHDVTVVASDYAMDESRFDEGPFEVVLLPNLVTRWGFYLTPGLVSWARDHVPEFDVIHMHTTRTFQNAVVRHYALRYGVPYVLSAHGTVPVIVERKLAKRLYDLLVGQRLLASADRLVAVSPAEAEQYQQAGVEEDRIRVVYNGLDLDEFANLPPRGVFRRAQGVADGTRIVLYLGRLHRIKGIDSLLHAFARIKDDLVPCLLIVAGPDDGELAALQALAGELGMADWVRFTGPLYGVEKLSAYVDADVLASPAVYEIFGLVPFEALLCGTSVIVTGDCGSGDLIHEAKAGLVVPHGDVEGLAEALAQALTDDKTTAAQVSAGQAFVRRELDWASIVDEMEELYSGLAVSHA